MSLKIDKRSCRSVLLGALWTYILLCFLFGGASREWLHFHYFLQAGAALGIALLVFTWPRHISFAPVRIPIAILGAVALIGALQLVPLPVDVWSSLPGRAEILIGFDSLEVTASTLPLSLDQTATLSGLGYPLTPLFVLLLCVRIGIDHLQTSALLLLSLIAVSSATFGLVQVLGGRNAALYFYDNTNVGSPVGLFANVNHFAAALLTLVPFTCLLLLRVLKLRKLREKRVALSGILFAGILLIFTGIFAAGSMAIYLLTIPILGLTLIALHRPRASVESGLLSTIPVILVFIFGGVVAASSPLLSGLGNTGSSEGPTSRYSIWSDTLSATEEYWPFGSGMATYQRVIPKFESPEDVTSRFVALAHNEYLQIAMELGLPGVLVIFVASIWIIFRSREVWFGTQHSASRSFKRMAVIGMLVILLHSVVDYPSRTPAIASLIGLFAAIVSLPQRADRNPNRDKSHQITGLVL